MSDTMIVVLFSVGALAFFVVGMSLTLMFKGHHIKSEISDNENMKNLGIKCAVQESREDIQGDCDDIGCNTAGHNCAACSEPHAAVR